jgi:diphthine synthase
MTLYLIGLGLCDQNDITLRGLEAIKKCSIIYFENYTSVLQCTIEDIEKLVKKKIIKANREQIENNAEQILKEAEKQNVAILIIGDPMSATTHVNFMIEAKKRNIKCEVVHNASILTAIGITGLQLYKFGKTTSMPFIDSDAPVQVIKENKKNNLHTLILLDLVPEKNQFLTIAEAAQRLAEKKVISEKSLIIAAARIGCQDQIIKAGTIKDIKQTSFGKPPFCLIIPATKLHFIEEEALDLWD